MDQTQDDRRLNRALNRWRDIEPSPGFENGVWRQIRAAETAERERPTFATWLLSLLPQPAAAVPVGLALAILIGVWGGIRSVPVTAPGQTEIDFLSAGTLTGGYAQLISGESR